MELKTADSALIIVSRRALDHLAAHPEVLALLPEAAGRVRLPSRGRRLQEVVDFGRVIGKATRVQTPQIAPHQPTSFAVRTNRDYPSRVAEVHNPPPVCTLVLAAGPTAHPRRYELITAFLGTQAPPEPWSLPPGLGRQVAVQFWCSEALVHDPSVMSPVFKSTWAQVLARRDSRGPK